MNASSLLVCISMFCSLVHAQEVSVQENADREALIYLKDQLKTSKYALLNISKNDPAAQQQTLSTWDKVNRELPFIIATILSVGSPIALALTLRYTSAEPIKFSAQHILFIAPCITAMLMGVYAILKYINSSPSPEDVQQNITSTLALIDQVLGKIDKIPGIPI